MNALLSFATHSFSEGLVRLSPVAANVLIASVLGGVLLATVAALALRLLPRLPAAVRSAIWLSVLLVVVLSPAMPFLFAARQAHGVSAGLLHADPRWSYALIAVWITFSLFRLGQLAVSARQLRGLARRAVALAPCSGVMRILDGSHRRVQLCSSTEVDRPSVAGFFHPRILLPPTLLASLKESELEQIVLHEMEHLRRHDDWTNLLQKISVALLPLHPVVAWLDRRLCLERELACDDGVVRATHARKSYAACLANLAEQSLLRRSVSLALGALGTNGLKPRSEVAKRVYRILSKPETAMGRVQSRVAAGVLFAGVMSGAVALAHTPHLISFAPPAETALAAAPPLAEAPPALTAHAHLMMANAASRAPHATFAKAIMTSRPAATSLTKTRRKSNTARTWQQQQFVAEIQEPRFLESSYRLATWSDSDVAAPRFALAVQPDSRFVYAAVPVRGGWLIVQL